ncbi:MAG: PAS domain S-box protein [Actinomycetota bacterium]|nr:PAS domain S-box protein [Actinomycetota bacterium]
MTRCRPAGRRRSVTRVLHLPPRPASAAQARHAVRQTLAEARSEEFVDDAQLLASELVTNAVIHAGTDIDLRVTADDSGVVVEVTDGDPRLPSARNYGSTATIGRGLLLLQLTAQEWGVQPRERGKTVWFGLGSIEPSPPTSGSGRPAGMPAAGCAPRAGAAPAVAVTLLEVPLLLHAVWQQHADALLREHLLAALEDPQRDGPDPVATHAAAARAATLLEDGIPPPALGAELGSPMEPSAQTAPQVRLSVPLAMVDDFRLLDATLDSAIELAEEGLLLLPATQPEIRELRAWLCREVLRQASGSAPEPWREPPDDVGPVRGPVRWDSAVVSTSSDAMVAADDTDRILAASPAALRLLGYDEPGQLVGRRIVAVIPRRLRQQHIAGFTLHLLTGRSRLLGATAVVPALRHDGTEVPVRLTLKAQAVAHGRTVFLATLTPA